MGLNRILQKMGILEQYIYKKKTKIPINMQD